MPYTKRTNRTYRKRNTYRKKTYRKPRYNRQALSQKPLYDKSSVKASDLKGFDKAIYKTDKILGQIGHGIDVVGKPVEVIGQIAKKLFGF